MRNLLFRALFLCSITLPVLLLPASALAQDVQTDTHVLEQQPPLDREVRGNYLGEPGIPPEMLTSGFLTAHPDIRWRREGSYSYNQKDYALAMTQFLRAARYADKPSQAMIAEMYWKGLGVAQDRELGYAWMDLAAERLYPNFVLKREFYWEQLDATQRQNAITRGQPLLAEYGDDAAKPRLVKVMRREASQITGSHAGFVSPGLRITPMTGPLAGTGIDIPAEKYYAPQYWQPQQYFAAQDAEWAAPDRQGHVRVGELEQADQAPAKDASKPPKP